MPTLPLALMTLSTPQPAIGARPFKLPDAVPLARSTLPAPAAKVLALLSLVRAAVSSLPPEQSQRLIDLDLDHGALRPPVQAEPIAHALLNLLTNACRYSSPSSRIRVRSELQWADGAQYLVVTVCDRGIGMSRPHQQRAFDAYWQGPAVNAGPGRGLGLSVARELVEAQGGWLELRSALGIGTEVAMWLPAPISADRAA